MCFLPGKRMAGKGQQNAMIVRNTGNNPFVAVTFFFKGVRLLTHPQLRVFIIMPVLANILLYSAALALGYYYVDQLITLVIPASLQWLEWILWPLFFIIFFIVGFFTFTIAANLLAAPFYGILAARTQALISGRAHIVEQPLSRVIAAEAKRLVYILRRLAPLLVLLFIPVVNIAAPFLLTLFSAWCLAMEFMAYPLENEGLLFADQKRLLATRRFGAWCFGAVTMLGLAVPVVNIVVGPAAVIGATMYVYDMGVIQQGGVQGRLKNNSRIEKAAPVTGGGGRLLR